MDTKTREKVFKERIKTIFNLGAVKLNTDTKKIQIEGDRFTVQKNLYGDEIASEKERQARINSLYDMAEILSDSKFAGKGIEESYNDPTVKPKNQAHKDVKYWYKFKNTISMDGVIYDVVFNIRDKGKQQYQYLIEFHEKNGDNSNQPYGSKNLRRTLDELSPEDSISEDNHTVNSKDMRDGEIYSQGKRVSFEKGERVGGNVVYNEESRKFAKKNREGYKVIQTMAKDLGMKVKFVKGLVDGDGNVLDGVITSEGIFINTEAKNPTRWAATHEFSHRMKQTGGKAWQKYQDYVIKHLKETGKYQAMYNAKKGAYAENEINEEIAADYIGELFSDVKELAEFIRESRQTAFSVRNMWYKVLDKLGLSDEKKKAQRMWASAYREAMKNSDAEYEDGVHESKSGTRVDDSSNSKYNEISEKLTRLEWKMFYNSLGELKRGMWFPQTIDGDYIFETDDKLIFTDGNYKNPKVNYIVEFESLNAEEIEYGKEIIWNEAENGKNCEECCEIAQVMLGKGTITSTNSYTSRTYGESDNNQRKGTNSKTADRGTRKSVSGTRVEDNPSGSTSHLPLHKGGLEVRSDATSSTAKAVPLPLEGEGSGGVKYSIAQNSKGKYVKASRQVIKGNNPKEWAGQVERYINDSIRKNKDVMFAGADGNLFVITTDTAGKARFRNVVDENGKKRRMTDSEYATKLRAETHIDELIQTSKTGKSRDDSKSHSFAKDGFNYRKAYFEDFDGTYYEVTISVGKNGIVNTVYNVGRLDKRTNPSYSGSKTNQKYSDHEGFVDKTRVAQKEPSVNSKDMQKGGKDAHSEKKVPSPEEAKRAKNVDKGIVVSEESKKLKKENLRAYNNIGKLATSFNTRAVVVSGLKNSKGEALAGKLSGGVIYVNADVGADKIARWAALHEVSHLIKQKQKNAKIWQRYENYAIKRLKDTDKYKEKYEAKKEHYEPEEINEELACDYIGELFESEAELTEFIRTDKSLAVKIRDGFYNALSRMGLFGERKKAQALWLKAYKAAMKSDAKSEQNKFKINPTFGIAFDNWRGPLKRRNGITLKVGSTSEALISIGVKEQTIYWDTTKINDALKKHPDVDIETLKYIPDLIENPVLIMEERNKKASRTHGNNRIFILGELYNENGLPVIAFLELEPKNNDGLYLNEIKVVSTYSKVDDASPESLDKTREFVKNSHLLYVDPNKNRTNNWLARNRLQLPFLPTTYGPINKITYSDAFVKNNSMQNDENYDKESVLGTRLSETEAKEDKSLTARLLEENARLRDNIEDLYVQMNQAEGKLNTRAVNDVAKSLKEKYGSKISIPTLRRELAKLYTYMSGKNVDGAVVLKRISSIAKDVIDRATETIEGGEYSELLKTIKETRIQVPESDKASFSEGYENFRKHSMGKLKLVKEGYPLDALWSDLVSDYPYLFSEDIVGSEERLNRILEVREEMRPSEESIYKTEAEYDNAVTELENAIMGSFFEIPEGDGGSYTFFEAKYTDRFSREKLRSRIDSDFTYLHGMLKEPTDKRHVPEHLRAEVAAVLDCIKFETKQLDKIRDAGKEAQSPTAIKLAGISGLYEDIIRKAWGVEKSGESKLLDEYLSSDLLELKESIPVDESGEFKRLQDMSTEELRVIGDVLRGIHHAVTKSNQAFTEGIKATIDEASGNVVAELATTRSERKGSGQKLEYGKANGIKKAISGIDKFMNVDMLQPWDMFHKIGGTLESIYGENRKAFDRHIANLRNAIGKTKDRFYCRTNTGYTILKNSHIKNKLMTFINLFLICEFTCFNFQWF